jgi:hypothetical protein
MLPLRECVRFLLIIVCYTTSITALHAQDLRVRILDGRSGHPISNEQPQVWIGHENGSAIQLQTNQDGIADVHLRKTADADYIRIEANHYYDCRRFQKDAARPSYSVKEIIASGVVGEDTCGKLQIEPKRGEVILFVRPLHWWEGLKR